MIDTIQHKLRIALEAAFLPTTLMIINESDYHAGHSEAGDSGDTHFRVRIAAPALHGLSSVAQHRAIYKAVAQLMPNPIHALAIEVLALD